MGVIVRKLGHNDWAVRICLQGRRRSRRFHTRDAAEAHRKALEVQVARGEDVFRSAPAVPTLKEFAASWLRSLESRVRSSTVERYKCALENYVLPKFGDRRIDSITRAELVAFVQELNDAPLRRVALMRKTGTRRVTDTGRKFSRSSVMNIVKPVTADVGSLRTPQGYGLAAIGQNQL